MSDTLKQPELGELVSNSFGDKYFVNISDDIFSNAFSDTVFGRYFKDTFGKPDSLYIIAGTDSGLLPQYLAKHFADKREGQKFVFVDFAGVYDNVDIDSLPDWISCYTEEFNLAHLSFIEVEYLAYGRLSLVKSLCVIDAKFDNPYFHLWKEIDKGYHSLMFSENVSSATRSFVDAQLLNLHRNIKPLKVLRNKMKGHDVVLLGGGPSLDASIDWIKAHADKLVIIAAGRIAARLIDEGIQADFYVSVDPNDASYDNSKKMLLAEEGTVLLNCHHINPKILSQWEHNAVYFGSSTPWQEVQDNSSSPGPTVIHSALHQAIFMGASRVFLSGVDLCFYGGKTHAKGSIENEFDNKIGIKNLTRVETYSGEYAETDHAFNSGVNSLEWLVDGYREKAPDSKVYNLGLYAAKVNGVDFIEQEEIQFEDNVNKFELMFEINNQLSVSQEDYLQHYEEASTELKDIRKQLSQIVSQAKKSLKVVKQCEEKNEVSTKLAKQRELLDKKLDRFGHMLYHYGIGYFKDVFKPVNDESSMSNEEVFFTLNAFFNGMLKATSDLIEQIDKVLSILSLRKKEFLLDSSPKKLFDAWKENSEYGRCRIWSNYHKGLDISDEDTDILEQAKSLFYKDILDDDTKHSQFLKSRSQSTLTLYKKAIDSFEEKNLEQLDTVSQQLKTIDSFESKQIEILIKGMVADLQEDSACVGIYEEVLFKPFKLFTLKRILFYSMQAGDHERVLKSFEELCNFSYEYMLPYADYLIMLNQLEFAQNVLLLFIQKMPEHFSAKLKLAETQIKMGLNPQALNTLEHALLLEPDNKQVQKMITLLS